MKIETERLQLIDLAYSDWDDMFRLFSDKDSNQYIDYINFENDKAAQTWFNEIIKSNNENPRDGYNFKIVTKSDNKFVGWIGIGSASNGQEGEMDFGYAFLKESWGYGYATEALKAVLDFALNTLHAKFITGECDLRNIGSLKVMEKCGMKFEKEYKEKSKRTGEMNTHRKYRIDSKSL